MRLSIEITPEQHQKLKAIAALQGKTIKDYVLERSLPNFGDDDSKALEALENFLKPRVKAAKNGDFSEKSVSDIFDEIEKGDDSQQ